MATQEEKPKSRSVVLLSDTVIERDPRVRKFAQTLMEAGWHVSTLGLAPRTPRESQLPWHCIHIALPEIDASVSSHEAAKNGQKALSIKALVILGKLARPLSQRLAFAVRKAEEIKRRDGSLTARLFHYLWLWLGLRVFPQRYEVAYWKNEPKYAAFLEAGIKGIETADLWIANDWNMLPIALKLSEEKGGRVLYDSHEYAIDQFADDRQWKRFARPLVKAVERACITRVDAISAVSPGICDALHQHYGLAQRPVCIRNIPQFEKTKFRPSGAPLVFLYQGVVGPGRGLEALIQSTPLWTIRARLIIRGPEGRAGYAQELEVMAGRTSTSVEINIEPPVPFDALIAKAREADVGIMALNNASVHNQYALPNKLFEYMMAGLALCVSNCEDMADIIAEHKTGVLIESLSVQNIAAAINSLDEQSIDTYKRASLLAAKQLNWENERSKLIALCAKII